MLWTLSSPFPPLPMASRERLGFAESVSAEPASENLLSPQSRAPRRNAVHIRNRGLGIAAIPASGGSDVYILYSAKPIPDQLRGIPGSRVLIFVSLAANQ